MKHIKCRWHEEDTPSLYIYPNAYHCFGCGKHGPLSDLGLLQEDVPEEKPKENLEYSIKYIKSLPIKLIRGLVLPYDDKGYYIVWDNGEYYKRRNWEGKPKYKNPSGHKQPPFWARREGHNVLIVVEGELNAMTVAHCLQGVDVVSPGASSQFNSKKLISYLTKYYRSSIIVIIGDRDAAGAEAVINLSSSLPPELPRLKCYLMQTDANDLLERFGCEEVRRQLLDILGKDVEAGSERRSLSS